MKAPNKALLVVLMVASFALMGLNSYALAQYSQITSGLSWLTANQSQGSYWTGVETTYYHTTAAVLETLSILQSSDPSYTNGLNWLNLQTVNDTFYLSERISINGVAYSADDLNAGLSYRQADGGYGGFSEYVSNTRHTALALFALKSASYSDFTTIGQSLNYLTAHQNPDGGWGFDQDGNQASDTYYTAIAIHALSLYKSTFIYQTQITNAVNYLLSQQNPDGGFGSSPSTVYETALSLVSLIESGQGQAQPLQNAINYLTSNQQLNGSWNDDPYSTALALRALAYVRPNLALASTDISFSNTMPQVGTEVTITANVRNTGLEAASNVTVRFYLGDPASGGTQIGTDQIIASLAANSSAQVSVIQTFTATGSKTIYVVVDPDNLISETSETDNKTSARLWVATAPDIAIFSEDIKPSTFTPASGTPFTLEYTIRNLGESAAGGFDVAVYDGSTSSPQAGPSTGSGQAGTLLQTIHISGIAGSEVRPGTIGVTLTGNGPHTLYLVAESGNVITEISETNNTGTATVNVGGTPTLADLAIGAYDITLNPSRPKAGDTVQVTARFRNQGVETADNFTLEIYDGSPDSGGTPILSQAFTLPAGAEQTVTTNWTIPAGIHELNVVLDRGNQVIEANENNNRAVARVMTDMVDIALSATDLTFTPANPVNGDYVVLSVNLHNTGIKDTGAFNLALYDGDPSTGSGQAQNGGQGQAQPLQTFQIANIPDDGSVSVSYSFTAVPWTYRFYAVADTENVVVEMSDSNNFAIRSLKIKAPGEILGPDLVPVKIDLANVTTNAQTLSISGTAAVSFRNDGDAKITTPFNVIVFDDADNDGKYTPGVDTLLGTASNTTAIWPEGMNMLNIPLSGKVRFLNSPLYAMIDSSDALLEQDEDNNIMRSGTDCENRPLTPIEPVRKWTWAERGHPIANPPAVAPLIDTNGDGKVDANDVPAIIFTEGTWCWGGPCYGRLTAVRGDTGQTIFSIQDPAHPIEQTTGSAAVGDIDGDGYPEIVVARKETLDGSGKRQKGLLVYDHTGQLKWDNWQQVRTWLEANCLSWPSYSNDCEDPLLTISSGSMPVISDIEADGQPEIIVGSTVINADGTVRYVARKPYPGIGATGSGGYESWYASIVADIDLDGKKEILGGNTAYNSDGTIKWVIPSFFNATNVVGNFDDDPYPEIVATASNRISSGMGYSGPFIYLLEHDGNIKWGPVPLSNFDWNSYTHISYSPIIADFDGDGKPEIGIRAGNIYAILDKNGYLKQSLSIPINTSVAGRDHYSAPTVFDLNGDGRPEILFNNEADFKIFDGKSGTKLYTERFGGWTAPFQNVVIADVDKDGHADAVVVGYDGGTFSNLNYAAESLRVYKAKNNDWVGARSIWNEYDYHITNVNDDGSIPQYETPSWLLNNTYKCQQAIGSNPNPYLTPNLTASYLRAEQAPSTSSGQAAVNLSVRVGNGGAKEAPAGVSVTFYDSSTGSLQAGSGQALTLDMIIGTASTTRALNPGEYQDIIFNWSGGTLGLHNIYAVVDAAGSISECRKDDNETNADVTIQVEYPDLKVGAEDITIPAGPYYEGTSIPVTATVKNIGGLSASNIAVRLYNGNPASGGVQVGADQVIPTLSSGGSSPVTFSFDTTGSSGTNQLYVVVDPLNAIGESNEVNNMALITLQVQPPVLPDLAVNANDIMFTPVAPQEGDQVTVTATIRNLGIATGNILVRIAIRSEESGVISEIYSETRTVYPILGPGQTAVVQAMFDTAGLAGQRQVYVMIDPANAITESNENNNSASVPVFIQSAALSSNMVLDRASYQANDTVISAITVSNQTASTRNLTIGLFIKDSAGNAIATVAASDPLTIDPNGTVTLQKTWNTGKTLAGTYNMTAEISENSRVISRTQSTFTIIADKRLDAKATLDKISYNARENVTVSAVITSLSQNYIYEKLTAKISITDTNSAIVFTDSRSISSLMTGATFGFKDYWSTSTHAAGSYPVTIEVKDSTGTVIAAGTQSIVISSAISPKNALKGQVSVDKQSLLAGETATVSYSVTNVGNADLQNVTLSISTVHVSNQTVYDTLTYQAALPIGGTYTNTGQIDTAQYTAKDYLVILRANIGGIEETLAGTYFRVEGAPSAPSLAAPINGSDVLTFTPVLSVNNASDPNDDKITYEFELYEDSGLTQLATSSGVRSEESGGITTWPVPVSLTENQTYYWRSRAYDGKLYGSWMTPASFRVNTVNDPPTAPTTATPADGTAVSSLAPMLTVNNASDPDSSSLTYNFDVAGDPDFLQAVASGHGILSGQAPSTGSTSSPQAGSGQATTSWQAPALQENTSYYWRAQADDWLDVGPWSTTARFFVNTVNDAPTAPVIAAPVNNTTIAALSTDIVVNNSTDPDSTTISYFFEADTVPTFDSANIIRSGSPSTGSGQATTSWNLSDLKENTQYYIRAKASDGSAESPWSAVVGFFVNTVNDAPTVPTLANPSNGAGVSSFTPTLSVHNSTDPDRDSLTYDFELYSDAALTTLVSAASIVAETQPFTSWTVPVALSENSTYYWRARSSDGTLTSAWMPAASFTVNTANDAPTAPEVSSPADGSSVATLTPALAVVNAVDPDNSSLIYDFEVYSNGTLVASITGVPGDNSGITTVTLTNALNDNTVYQWRARAFDGDRYGAWTPMAGFTVHIPQTSITAEIEFEPETLNKKSKGTWVKVEIELPKEYKASDVDISSIRLEGVVPAEAWPYEIKDCHDDECEGSEVKVKFKRSDVINILPNGEHVPVHVTGRVGTVTFEGIDVIRVIQ